MIKYRKFIEDKFLIDEPTMGKLVPFKFRPVQIEYYDELVKDYDIEAKGIGAAVREIILKARREGFSSLILALFAADDLLSENPTESLVISYKDDATETFRKRYRVFVTSYYARRWMDASIEEIQGNPSILDQAAKLYLSADGSDIEHRHNKAHFYCGTASARVGGRGGVLQKVLFSEAAFYPDSELMSAGEIVDGTLRQVDISSGFVFIESTANGYGNDYEKRESSANKGESRFKSRFYGWKRMYSQKEFDLIASEFTDKAMLKQEYPATREEAYIFSGSAYFDNEKILEYIKKAPDPVERGSIYLECTMPERCRSFHVCDHKSVRYDKEEEGYLRIWEKPLPYHSYTLSADVSEGVNKDYSLGKVIDNKTLKTAAKWKSNNVAPHEFSTVLFALGMWYNFAYTGVESNKDGLWVNDELFKMRYPNLYFREQYDDITKKVGHKIGFKTDSRTRPFILSELRKMLGEHPQIWNDKEMLEECLVFVRSKTGEPQAMSGKNDDEIISSGIVYEIRRNAPEAFEKPQEEHEPTAKNYILGRLEAIKKKQNPDGLSQNFYAKL